MSPELCRFWRRFLQLCRFLQLMVVRRVENYFWVSN